MIYTVTLNPSLDYVVSVENFTSGRVNRTNSETIMPGGKGINVSIVLNNLGLDTTALGFVAGFTGTEICKRLESEGVYEQFIKVQHGFSRINVKLKSNVESEINGKGPEISEEEIQAFEKKLDMLKKGDVIFLAGSIPESLPDTMYRDIILKIRDKGIVIVVDAEKKLLLNVLELNPFLIKPNLHELEDIFNTKIESKEEIIKYAKELKKQGALNVLVSLAGDGALLVDEDGKIYESEAFKGEVVNSVGAGDSMVAGFMFGYLMEGSYDKAFKLGIAAGSAGAFSEGLPTKTEILNLFYLGEQGKHDVIN